MELRARQAPPGLTGLQEQQELRVHQAPPGLTELTVLLAQVELPGLTELPVLLVYLVLLERPVLLD